MSAMIRAGVLLLSLVLAGCASNPTTPPVAGANIDALKTEKIAVSYQLVAKRINYSEVLFRGVFLENRASTEDFSGVWQADKDLTGYIVARIKSQGFAAESVYAVANNDVIVAERRSVASKTGEQAALLPVVRTATSNIPPATFFEVMPRSPEYTALASALRAAGYRYLAEFTSMDIRAAAPGYGLVMVAGDPNLRIIDLQTDKVVWTRNLRHFESFQLGGDLKKLEENNMARTKDALRAGMDKLDFVRLWGVSPR
jgi:hypothetical protein